MTEKRKKRIYVAGALRADIPQYIKNLHQMNLWADRIRREGFAVYIPGLDFLIGLQCGNWDITDYFNNSIEWLRVADGIFIVPNSDKSVGVRLEIEEAGRLKIPIFDNLMDLKYGFPKDGQ